MTQSLKTRKVNDNCNPEWNDELSIAITDPPDLPLKLVSTPIKFEFSPKYKTLILCYLSNQGRIHEF